MNCSSRLNDPTVRVTAGRDVTHRAGVPLDPAAMFVCPSIRRRIPPFFGPWRHAAGVYAGLAFVL
jgi:hypothetical protein